MKKEGIQTRNRKLSSKSKKKKGMGSCLPIGSHLGMGDLMKPLDHSKAFSSGFSASMGKFSRFINKFMLSYVNINGSSLAIFHYGEKEKKSLK